MASQIPFKRPKNVSRHQTFKKDDIPNIRQRIGDKKESGILDRTKRFNHENNKQRTFFLLLPLPLPIFKRIMKHYNGVVQKRISEMVDVCMCVCIGVTMREETTVDVVVK
jgi:hypothetical protein